MHLLLAQKGSVLESSEPVDLGQTPAPLIFMSAADTEIAAIAQANNALGRQVVDLRLANLLALSHPMSVDTYLANTVAHAQLVVVRIIGGESYWKYGLQSLYSCAVANNFSLVVLPGDDRVDEGLAQYCTLTRDHCQRLWLYLVEGGADNSANFLLYCSYLIKGGRKPLNAEPIIKAGLWWPTISRPQLSDIVKDPTKPAIAITFYRALVQSGQTQPVSALIRELLRYKLTPIPIFISSLKDELSAATIEAIFSQVAPTLVLNATGFSVSALGSEWQSTVLDKYRNMVFQVVFSTSTEENWRKSCRGLSARDLAMNVAMPEVDGRILTRAVSFKSSRCYDEKSQCTLITHNPVADRVAFVAELASRWVRLKKKAVVARKIAIILANYPGGDGRLGHGVGLDTPSATVLVLKALQDAGYCVKDIPTTGNELIAALALGPTNEGISYRKVINKLPINDYLRYFDRLPAEIGAEVVNRWGSATNDPYFIDDGFALPLLMFGNVVVGIQPQRAHNADAKLTYHSNDIVPTHHYLAFYFWLRHNFNADAIVHMGKHGNLEWLPGKSLALSQQCYPEIALGAVPNIYPFIVNDPGEGTQAKRRTSAVIIDHLTPPLTRAESYGPLKDLEALVDEYYEASGVDPRRVNKLKSEILELVELTGLRQDIGVANNDSDDQALQKLDAFLCELKELQIRDGLHIFGRSPDGEQLVDLLVALARVPRGENEKGSLHRAIALDLALEFDPLDCPLSAPWPLEKPEILMNLSGDPWRNYGDGVERIEKLAAEFVSKNLCCPPTMASTKAILIDIDATLRPLVAQCGNREITALLAALDGRFVEPGPSGAPTRGRPDVLPTGRNFYSVDNRSVPTLAAWDLGKRSAELMIARYVQDNGEWPKTIGLTAWGTSNMRTGGDDIAQALALIGVKPLWDNASRRVTGYEVIPIAKLGRPRVDVLLRISGFFRDAFPEQIKLFDQAIRAVGALRESVDTNPIAARMNNESATLIAQGLSGEEAKNKSGYRIFGAKPGCYGTGIEELVMRASWSDHNELERAWVAHGSYAYANDSAEWAGEIFSERLGFVDAVVQNQDNREHDLLDSSEYYAFEGGMALAIQKRKGCWPQTYHNDLSRPQKPVIKTLEEEIGRTVRGRAANPKWIRGIMRHGYKGASEMAATVDYLFAFAATTNCVSNAHFDLIYHAYIEDSIVRHFMLLNNPAALREIASRLTEAIDRILWQPRSNLARYKLAEIIKGVECD